MDDISEKINSLLSDEESMRQIKELADMLTGGGFSDSPTACAEEYKKNSDGIELFDEVITEKPPANNRNEKENSSAPDLSGILKMLGGADNGQQNQNNASDDFDMGKIMQLMSVLQSANGGNDNNRNVLLALRPMLGADKQAKIDKALKMLKLYALYNAVKDSGISLL